MSQIIKPPFPQLRRGHPLTDGLVAAWMFHEGAGGLVHDIAGRNNHGTLQNMDPTTDWVGSPYGWALDFGGAASEGIKTAVMPITLPITFVARIKPTIGATGPIVSTAYRNNDPEGAVLFVETTGELVVRYFTGVGTSTSHQRTRISTATLSSGVWVHVAGVMRGATDMSLYRDGVELAGSYAGSGPSFGTGDSTEAAIGYYDFNSTGSTPSHRFTGQMASVLIYNKALTADEIAFLYRNPFAILEPPKRIFSASAAAPQSVTPDAAVWIFAAQTPTISAAVSVTPDPAVCTFSAQTPTISTAVTVSPDAAVFQFSAQTPTISSAVTVEPAAAVATFTANTPTISTAVTVSPSPAVLTFSVPSVTFSDGQSAIEAGVAVLRFVVPTATIFQLPGTNTASDLPRPLKAHFVSQRLDAGFEKQTLNAGFERQTLTAGFYRE